MIADCPSPAHAQEPMMEQSADISILLDPETNRTFHLSEIHAAPQWLWTALVKQMIESSWTVQVTRQSIAVRVPVSSSRSSSQQ